MKEYVITIKDKPYHVIIKKMRTDTAIVEVEGQEYEVGVDRKLKRHITPLEVKPMIKQSLPSAPVSTAGAPIAATGDDVVSPLPGLILSILVKVGDKVKSGQTVLKMEAMKMENEIKANKDGIIKKFFVNEGDSILENAPLVKIGD